MDDVIIDNETQPDKLIIIRDTLRAGRAVNPVTVREFLSWFGAKRRGVAIVSWIREELASSQLATIPDFEEPWIDGLIAFRLVSEDNAQGDAAASSTGLAEGVVLLRQTKRNRDLRGSTERQATGSVASKRRTNRLFQLLRKPAYKRL
ncbi:hypothetical protein ACFS32_24970 [Novosphingobium pokkalii]|uniref:hypothetical protein n=1 Tax=Novosphingobium pokkalii TaxID=1770194 RepID=UPI00362A2F37